MSFWPLQVGLLTSYYHGVPPPLPLLPRFPSQSVLTAVVRVAPGPGPPSPAACERPAQTPIKREPPPFKFRGNKNTYGVCCGDGPSLLLIPSFQRSLDLPPMDGTDKQSPGASKSPVGSPGKHQASKSPEPRSPSPTSGDLLPGNYWTEAAPLVRLSETTLNVNE